VPFTEEWLLSGHYHKGLIGEVLKRREILPEGQPSPEELWSSVRVNIGF
jgi:hypothetical protein